MRIAIAVLAVLLVSVVGYGQTAVKTEDVYNIQRHYSTAVPDTLADTLTTVTSNPGMARYLERISFNTVIASDTLILRQHGTGIDTVLTIVFGATPPAYPFSVEYGFKLDSTYVTFINKKGSDVNLIFRKTF